jgi:hypothetical protein
MTMFAGLDVGGEADGGVRCRRGRVVVDTSPEMLDAALQRFEASAAGWG